MCQLELLWMCSRNSTILSLLVYISVIISETKLYIGIVGNKFGNDTSLSSYLYNNLVYLPSWELEVASHGYNHEDFSTMTYAQQLSTLNSSLTAIRSKLPIGPIKTFIPPFDYLNSDTLTASQNLGITHISAQIDTDYTAPYPMSGRLN